MAHGRRDSAVIDLAVVCDAQDEDQEPVVLDRVDDAVVADPDAPPSMVATSEHLRPGEREGPVQRGGSQ